MRPALAACGLKWVAAAFNWQELGKSKTAQVDVESRIGLHLPARLQEIGNKKQEPFRFILPISSPDYSTTRSVTAPEKFDEPQPEIQFA